MKRSTSIFWDITLYSPLKAILGFIGLNGVIFQKSGFFITNPTLWEPQILHSLVLIISPTFNILEASRRQKGLKNNRTLHMYSEYSIVFRLQ
jgi:hypothetical protein